MFPDDEEYIEQDDLNGLNDGVNNLEETKPEQIELTEHQKRAAAVREAQKESRITGVHVVK